MASIFPLHSVILIFPCLILCLIFLACFCSLFTWLCLAGDKFILYGGACTNYRNLAAVSATAPGKGGGLLEKPIIEKPSPGRESEFDVRCTDFRTLYYFSFERFYPCACAS